MSEHNLRVGDNVRIETDIQITFGIVTNVYANTVEVNLEGYKRNIWVFKGEQIEQLSKRQGYF